MAQFARPTSTVTTGSWSAQGGPSTLHDCVDETSFSDTDYIRSSGGSASFCEVALGSIIDPLSSTGHTIRFRMRASGSGAAENLQCNLYQGSTLIRSSGNQTNRSASFVEKSFTLTGAEANSITDYSDLRLRFVPSHANGETIDVSWVEFETPDAPSLDRDITGAITGLMGVAGGEVSNTNPTFELTGSVNGLIGSATGEITFLEANNDRDISGSVTGLLGVAEGEIENTVPVYDIIGSVTGLLGAADGEVGNIIPVYDLAGSVSGPIGVAEGSISFIEEADNNRDISGSVTGLIGTSNGAIDTTIPESNLSGDVAGLLGNVTGEIQTGDFFSLNGNVTGLIGVVEGFAEVTIEDRLIEGYITGLLGIASGFTSSLPEQTATFPSNIIKEKILKSPITHLLTEPSTL